jgi:hypothetical protein
MNKRNSLQSVLLGAARMADPFGTLRETRLARANGSGWKHDAQALRGDWQRVGRQVQQAADAVGRDLAPRRRAANPKRTNGR